MNTICYTPEEIAARYSVKKQTVWSWLRSGLLTSIRVGRIYRIRPCDIEAFEAKQLVTGGAV